MSTRRISPRMARWQARGLARGPLHHANSRLAVLPCDDSSYLHILPSAQGFRREVVCGRIAEMMIAVDIVVPLIGLLEFLCFLATLFSERKVRDWQRKAKMPLGLSG